METLAKLFEEKRSEELLTVFDCERITKKKVPWWRLAIARREIPIVRLGRSVRIPREFVEQMIKQGWENPITRGGENLNGD